MPVLQEVVEKLLSSSRDTTALSCSFQRLLQLDDVRYHVMIAVRGNLAAVMAASRGVGEISPTLSLLSHLSSFWTSSGTSS